MYSVADMWDNKIYEKNTISPNGRTFKIQKKSEKGIKPS